jgi:hypothetical protein
MAAPARAAFHFVSLPTEEDCKANINPRRSNEMHAIKAVIVAGTASILLSGCTVLAVNVPLGSWVAQKVLHNKHGNSPGTSITKPQEPKK